MITCRLENPVFNGSDCAWGEDPDYYNDLPGKVPPEAQPPLPPLPDYHQNGVEVITFYILAFSISKKVLAKKSFLNWFMQ